jgi:hypothetical protein
MGLESARVGRLGALAVGSASLAVVVAAPPAAADDPDDVLDRAS